MTEEVPERENSGTNCFSTDWTPAKHLLKLVLVSNCHVSFDLWADPPPHTHTLIGLINFVDLVLLDNHWFCFWTSGWTHNCLYFFCVFLAGIEWNPWGCIDSSEAALWSLDGYNQFLLLPSWILQVLGPSKIFLQVTSNHSLVLPWRMWSITESSSENTFAQIFHEFTYTHIILDFSNPAWANSFRTWRSCFQDRQNIGHPPSHYPMQVGRLHQVCCWIRILKILLI